MLASILMLDGMLLLFLGSFIAVLCMWFAYALSQENNPRWGWFLLCSILILLWSYGINMSITIIDNGIEHMSNHDRRGR